MYTAAQSTIACITAFSKSRVTPVPGVCTIKTPMSFSFGSTLKWVPKAPSYPKLPFDVRRLARTLSSTTSMDRPKPIPSSRAPAPAPV